MPKGTKVSRCVDKVKKSKDEGAAIAICQDSTNQGYATGRKLKESIAKKAAKFMVGKQAKKLKDSKDDSWEKEEKKKGYKTPSADDATGYDAPNDDNASDDFSDGAWNKEDAPKKYKKKLKESLLNLVEKQAAKRVNSGKGDSAGSSDSDEYVSGGKTGRATIQGRLTGIRTKKASPSAGVRVSNYTAGPKKKLPGAKPGIKTEAQSFSKTQTDAMKDAAKPLNPKPKKAKTPSLTAGGNTTAGANAAGDEGVPVGNDANKKAQELKQQNIKNLSMYEGLAGLLAKGVVTGLAFRTGRDLGKKHQRLLKDKKDKKEGAVEEAAPLVAAGAKVVASQLLRRGAVVAGRKAAQGSVKRSAATAARKLAKNPDAMGALGSAAEKGYEKLKGKRKMEDSTQYKNNYVRRLMEMEGPTDKELKAIKKEKPAKIPKKKYFGGETDIKKVDTRAAIASHKKAIRAAGEATKPKSKETNEGRSSFKLRQSATQSQGLKRRKDTSVGGPQGKEVAAKFVKKALAGYTKPAIGGNPRKPKASEMNSHTEYHRIGKLFAEAHQSHIDSESKKELARGDADAGFAGPTARRIGRGQTGTSDIKDQGVKKLAKAAGERVKAKVPGAKPEKIATKHLVGAAMIRKRRESRQRLKAGKGREGDGIPKETPDIAKADAAHSRKKVQDAGER